MGPQTYLLPLPRLRLGPDRLSEPSKDVCIYIYVSAKRLLRMSVYMYHTRRTRRMPCAAYTRTVYSVELRLRKTLFEVPWR